MYLNYKCIIHGVGKRLDNYIHYLDLDNIVCFVDKKYDEYKNGYKDKEVISPECINRYEYDLVVVSSNKYYEEIVQELVFKYSVPIIKIISLDNMVQEIKTNRKQIAARQLLRFMARYDKDRYKSVFGNTLRYHPIHISNFLRENGINLCRFDGNNPHDLKLYDKLYIQGILFRAPVYERIKIYVASHKEFPEVKDPIYTTVWIGKKHEAMGGMKMQENYGDINYLNPLINECTALYSIWKYDKDSEYIGLNHYRRYFESPLNPGLPLQKWEVITVISDCDIIVAEAYIHTCTSKEQLGVNLCKEAYEAGVHVLSELFESRSEAEKNALQCFWEANVMYPCQMFIMRRELLNDYCSWLFPILFELVDKVEINDEWDAYSKRIIGFIAERLFTVWLLLTGYSIEELPVLQTDDSEPYGLSK